MHVRSVGATGLKVSRLGLGTMTWGRDTDEHEARDQLIAFAEAGGTLVDTAAGYGDGASEELIGSLIGDVVARDEIVIATKAGISRRTGTRVTDASRGTLLAALDGSLARLGVDHVDLWQVHTWVRRRAAGGDAVGPRHGRGDRPGVVRRGVQLRRAGRPPRRPPGSGRSPGRAPLASTQMEYSLLNRAIEDEVLPAAQRPRPRACCRGPRSAAACSPASTAPAPRPTRGPPRPTSRGFVGAYLGPRSQRIVEAVARAAEGLGWTPLEVALAWVRDRPGRDRTDRGRPDGRSSSAGALGVEELDAARRDHPSPRRRLGVRPTAADDEAE